MPTIVDTQNADLREILQDKLPVLTFDDPVFTDIMPISSCMTEMVMWEQRDNYVGLLSPREYDGGFGRVAREGINRWAVLPGKYGDQKQIKEAELASSRQMGSFGDVWDVRKIQAGDQDHLLTRAIVRLKKIAWDLVINAVYSVPDLTGKVLATDTFNTQTFTAAIAWSNLATATPLADIRAMKLKARGSSVRFDKSAKIYLNATTINYMLMNTNTTDLGGKRTMNAGGQIQPLGLDTLNQILLDNNLPIVVEYDGTYQDEAGTITLYIPDNKGVLIGARENGEPVAEFFMTPNPNNLAPGGQGYVPGFSEGMQNLYYDFEWKKNPIRGISTLGLNGAPAVYYGSAVVRLNL